MGSLSYGAQEMVGMDGMHEITYSPARALELLLFLVRELKAPTIHEVLKLLYFADKMHLSKFGCMATGDNYVAMKFGPVASNTYNLMKAARGDRNYWIHPAFYEIVKDSLTINDGKTLRALRAPDYDLLTDADLECLGGAIKMYGDMSFAQRTEISHDAAWVKAWEAANADEMNAGDMGLLDIAGTIDNASEVLEHLKAGC